MEKLSKYSEDGEKPKMPGFQGNIYQSKLLMLYLHRGLSSKYNFELGTEIEEADKYDDLVFKYGKTVDRNEKNHFILLQSKHKAGKNSRITFEEMFTDGNVNFGLVKYYYAFKRAKNDEMFKNGTIEHVIIHTNAHFDMFGKIPEKNQHWQSLRNIKNVTEEIKVEKGSVLSLSKVEEQGKYYQFKSDLVLSVLKPMLSIYYNIAQKLVKYLKDSKYLSSEDVFKNYDCLLADEVIDMKSLTFRCDFLNEEYDVENATGRQKLRKALDEVLKDEKLNIEEIAKMKFIARKNFGKKRCLQKWPSDETDEDIKEFLQKLIFAIGQPDEIKLGKIILSELDEKYKEHDADFIYSYFSNEIQAWMKGEQFVADNSKNISEYRFISSQHAKEFFAKAKRKFEKMVLKGPTIDYDKYIKTYNINFVFSELENPIKSFLFSGKRMLNIISEHITISSIKVYKELLKTFIKNKTYIKLSSSNASSIDSAIEAFGYESSDHLLVIESDSDRIKSDDAIDELEDICIRIIDLLKSNDKKKIIVISNEENVLKNNLQSAFFRDDEFEEVIDVENTLKNLSEDSQMLFLNATVNFQEHKVKLGDLIIDDGSKGIINSEVLLKILKQEEILIGKKVEGLKTDIENNYVSRTFIREIKNDLDDLKHKMNEEDLCFYSGNQNFKSIGENLNEPSIDEPNYKVNLISAIAGMGKSTLFTHLSRKVKKKYPTMWVIKIDLNTVSSKLNEIKMSGQNDFRTIIEFLHCGANHESQLEKRIFESHLSKNNVVLYLDGFDEICPYYEREVLKIIKELDSQTKIRQIWLSTRPYDSIIENLRNSFENLQHYEIEPFTEDNQKEYLKSYWKKSIEINDSFFDMFVTELLTLLNNNINDRRKEFLGIALHTNMIGITFEDTFQEFQNAGSSKLDEEQTQRLLEMLQLSKLYEKFVELKYKFYYENKAKLNLDTVSGKKIVENSSDNIIKKFKLLALDSLYSENQLEILLTEHEIEDLKEYENDIKKNGDGLGIANRIINDKPHFIHRTFAEYFVAIFFIENFKREDKKSKRIIEHFLKNTINEGNSVICKFVDSMWDDRISHNNYDEIKKMKKGIIHFVLENNWSKIALFLIANDINLDCINDGNSLLHLVISLPNLNERLNLLNLILEKLKRDVTKLKTLLETEDSGGNTPFSLAVKYGRLYDTLWEEGKELEISNTIFTKKNRKGENIFHQAAGEYCNDIEFINLLNIMKSDRDKLINLLLEEDQNKNIPFNIAAKHGKLKKLETILEICQELNISDDVFTNEIRKDNLFHRAAEDNWDDVSLIYLLDLFESDQYKLKVFLQKRDKNGNTPLNIAAKYGRLNKLQAMLKACEELQIIDNAFTNENLKGENMFHQTAGEHCNDGSFIHLLNVLQSDPEKLKVLLLKKDNNENIPFNVAVMYGQFEKLEAILNVCKVMGILNTVITNENRKGENIFHQAAGEDCTDDSFIHLLDILESDREKLRFLLLKKDNNENIPFNIAAKHGKLKKLEAMLKVCRDLKILDTIVTNRNRKGENIFHQAAGEDCNDNSFNYLLNVLENDQDKLKILLLQEDNNENIPFNIAARHGILKKLEAMLNTCKKIGILNTVITNDNRKDNMFHRAAEDNWDDGSLIYLLDLFGSEQEKLRLLLLKQDKDGNTPLNIAAKYGHVKKLEVMVIACKTLQISDSVFTYKNRKGENIFHLAAGKICDYDSLIYLLDSLNDDQEKLKKILLEENNDGDTPLGVAKMFRKSDKLEAMSKYLM